MIMVFVVVVAARITFLMSIKFIGKVGGFWLLVWGVYLLFNIRLLLCIFPHLRMLGACPHSQYMSPSLPVPILSI